MSDARTGTVANMTTRFNYELRNAYATQWEAAETLEYVNKWAEFIHDILTEHESDLVKTGSGDFVTVAGTELYDLSDNDMGDLITPLKVWVSGSAEIEICDEADRMAHIIEKEQGTTAHAQPGYYYLEGENIGLLPIPDAVYTIKLKYIPNFAGISATTEAMPFKNIFNNVFVEGVKIIAKNREGYGTAVDAALMELFQDRCMSILRKRQKQDVRFTP